MDTHYNLTLRTESQCNVSFAVTIHLEVRDVGSNHAPTTQNTN